MEQELHRVEGPTPFSRSKLWQFNRDFYVNKGLSAFSQDLVPHHLTSNSLVGITYAKMIFGFLQDRASLGQDTEVVHIVELGAGHGRLGFFILTELDKLVKHSTQSLPPYCYVLTDIVEENLSFFQSHPQFKSFIERGLLDISYFDAINSNKLHLKVSGRKINREDLKQPLIAIANYFFDSIPSELFRVKNKTLFPCTISIQSTDKPQSSETETVIANLQFEYQNVIQDGPMHSDPEINKLLESYKELSSDTYIFFPESAIKCIRNLKSLSSKGLFLLSIDKGYHELKDLENHQEPEVITHGSFSIWVNFHALAAYCKLKGGQALFPTQSNFHMELMALSFLEKEIAPGHTQAVFRQTVEGFGPDDFKTLMKQAYTNVAQHSAMELLALYRLSSYDPTFFIKLSPRLKQVIKAITHKERRRLAQAMEQVWKSYFSIGEAYDLAFELGSIHYDLGYYQEALKYFDHSEELHGKKSDTYYNQVLCHYQLRQDRLFYKVLAEAKTEFPDATSLLKLEALEMI